MKSKYAFSSWPPCEGCQGPVSVSNGIAVVRKQDAELYEAATVKINSENDVFIDVNDLIATVPPTVHWHWGHSGCVPDDYMYYILAEHLDGVDRVLSWTLHLYEKSWFDLEGWRQFALTLCDIPCA